VGDRPSETPEMNDSALVDFLKVLVTLPSHAPHEGEALQRIAAEMRRLNYDDVTFDSDGNVIGRLGSGRPVLLVDGHVDTIPPHSIEAWTSPPLTAPERDGRVYGLGTVDMKGPIAAFVHGLARLGRGPTLRGTVCAVCSHAEEVMEGAALASTVKRIKPDFVIIAEPTALRLCHAQRGRAKVEVQLKGRAVHAAHASLGVNPAEQVADVIRDISRGKGTTMAAGIQRQITCIGVQSHPYPSVSTVPNFAVAQFDCRLPPSDTEKTVLMLFDDAVASIRRLPSEKQSRVEIDFVTYEFISYAGTKLEIREFAPGWETAPTSGLVRACLAGLEGAGLAPTLGAYQFCTNGSYTAGVAGIPTVGFGPGLETDAHTVDESIAIDALIQAAKGYENIARAVLRG
jgi:putative selenium metabolism hydrolase